MAIEGPLRELALSDVLQLLDLSRKTGRLEVRREGGERPVELLLEQGAIVGVRAVGRTLRLGELVVLAGKATEAQVRAALERQARAPGRLLGALLVESGAVAEAEVRRHLRFQVEELIYDLVRWTDGYFRFEERATPPAEIAIRVPTEALLMEAMRRLDEWQALGVGAPDAELVPALAEAPPSGGVLELDPGEWEVLAAIDGERTLRAVARQVGRPEFEVARAVFALVDAGIVEVGGRRQGAGAPVRAERGDARAAVEAALAAGRPEEAERLLAGLPAGAEAHLVRGRVEAGRGRWAAAEEALEAAVAADPLLAEAYRWLGVCRARRGALAEAAAALATYLRLGGEAGGWRGGAERGLRAIRELQAWLREESDEPAR